MVSNNLGPRNNINRAGEAVTSVDQSDIQSHALLPELSTTSFDWPIIIIGFWLGVGILWIFIQLERQRRFSKDMRATSHPCLLYTSPSPRDRTRSRMPSSA